jgi:esterase/lipase
MYSIDDVLLTHFFMWKKFDAKAKLKVTRKITGAKKSEKAILFFPFWSGKSDIYLNLSKNFKDYTLIYYDYPKETMSKNIKVSLNYLRQVLKDAFFLILELRKRGYKEITLVGSSLGSNISLKLATMVRVDKIVLNMIDRSLAREIFTSPALAILKKRLEKQGVTLEKMEKIYSFISTEQILPVLKKTNTQVLLYLSKNDIFCSLEEFKPVISRLEELQIKYKLRINRFLGHILSIYKNLFFNKEIINFIKGE